MGTQGPLVATANKGKTALPKGRGLPFVLALSAQSVGPPLRLADAGPASFPRAIPSIPSLLTTRGRQRLGASDLQHVGGSCPVSFHRRDPVCYRELSGPLRENELRANRQRQRLGAPLVCWSKRGIPGAARSPRASPIPVPKTWTCADHVATNLSGEQTTLPISPRSRACSGGKRSIHGATGASRRWGGVDLLGVTRDLLVGHCLDPVAETGRASAATCVVRRNRSVQFTPSPSTLHRHQWSCSSSGSSTAGSWPDRLRVFPRHYCSDSLSTSPAAPVHHAERIPVR